MKFQRGDVWLVKYPYTDLTATKVRPAIVCSTDAYHVEQPDIIVAAVTSNISAATGTLDYVLKDWAAAGLKFESAFKPVVATLGPSLAIHRIGALSADDLNEVETRLRVALGI